MDNHTLTSARATLETEHQISSKHSSDSMDGPFTEKRIATAPSPVTATTAQEFSKASRTRASHGPPMTGSTCGSRMTPTTPEPSSYRSPSTPRAQASSSGTPPSKEYPTRTEDPEASSCSMAWAGGTRNPTSTLGSPVWFDTGLSTKAEKLSTSLETMTYGSSSTRSSPWTSVACTHD